MTSLARTPFATLAEMRDAHNMLVKRVRAQQEQAEHVDAARLFVLQGTASGKLLDSTAERAAAQSLLDYWATVLFRHDSGTIDATLEEFEPELDRTLRDEQCPYPGVNAFDASLRAHFHGRRSLVSSLVSLLGREDVVCLLGETGVGKTSLLQAGLLPALKERDDSERPRRFLPTVVPGSDPLGNLARAVLGDDAAPQDRRQELVADESCLTRWLDDRATGAVLAVDGLEELLALCADARARAAFAANIVFLANQHRRHLLILAMRTGWLADLAEQPDLLSLAERHKVTVPPLAGPEVLEAIQAPAARVGLTFQEGLAETLAQDFLNEPPALLQFALTNLWGRRQGTRVSSEAYALLGRGRQVVCATAERLGAAKGSPNEQAVSTILLAFLRPGTRSGEVRTTRVARADLLASGAGEGIETALNALVAVGLLRTSESNTPGDVRLEWIHDVLKDAVPAVQTWFYQRELQEAKAIAEREGVRADREANLKRKATTRAWAFAVAGAVALLLAVVTIQQLGRREVMLLTTGAERLAQTNPDLAVALAARALLRAPGRPEAVGAAYKTFFESGTKRVYPRNWTPHSGAAPVSSIAVTADGRHVLAGQTNADDTAGMVTFWDLESGAQRPLRAGTGVTSVAITPAGDLAMGGAADGTVTLLDTVTGAQRTSWTHHDRRVTSLAFSPDGQRAASASEDKSVWIWTRSLAGAGSWRRAGGGDARHRDDVSAVVFSGDGRLLFSGEDDPGAIMIWDVESGQLVDTLEAVYREERPQDPRDPRAGVTSFSRRPIRRGRRAGMTSLAVRPSNCSLLAGADDGTLRWWNLSVGRPALAKYLGAHCLAGAEPQRSMTAKGDAETVEGSRTFAAHEDAVSSVAFGPDGRYAISGSEDRTVILWRVDGHRLERLRTFRGHQGPVQSVAFPAGDFFVSGSEDGSVRVWDLDAPLEIGHFEVKGQDGASAQTRGVSVTADGQVVVAAAPSVFSEPRSSDSVDTRQGRGASSGQPVVDISRWDLASSQWTGTFQVSYLDTLTPAFDRTGTRVVTGTDLDLDVWDLADAWARSGAPAHPKRSERVRPEAAALGDSGTIAWVSTQDLRPAVASLASGGAPRRFDSLKDDVLHEKKHPYFSLAMSSDGRWLAVGTQKRRVLLFDVEHEAAAPRHELVHTDRVTAVAFRPGGNTLASGSRDGTIILSDTDGRELGRLRGHTNEVTAMAFSPDGRLLLSGAVGSEGSRLLLWHVDSGTIVYRFGGHTAHVRSVAISHDGRLAVSGAEDGSVSVWRLPTLPESTLRESVGSRRWTRELTPEEEAEFGVSWVFDLMRAGGMRQ